MQVKRGFTIVELIIVLVIIAILLMLSILLLNGNQANGRDAERNADISAIARGLETRYKEGNPEVTAPSYVTPGDYPGTNEMRHIMGVSISGFTPAQITGGYPGSALPGTTVNNFSPPGVTSGSFTGFNPGCTSSCSGAPDRSSSVTTSTYVYQPIDAKGDECIQGGCVRFKLYYRTEVDNVVHVIESKHQ